jgi:hypothetical protein
VLLAVLSAGCAAGPPPRTTTEHRETPAKLDASASLAHDLRAIEDLGSPLNALDVQTRGYLDAELLRFSEGDRKQLQSDPALASARPLLHLAVFGALPVAYQRLSSGLAAADEVAAAHLTATDAELAGLAATVNRVSELAARRVVRDAVAEHSDEAKWNDHSLLRVADALQTLQNWPLLQRVLQQLSPAAANAHTRQRLALALVQNGDLSQAKAQLERDAVGDGASAGSASLLAALAIAERAHVESLEQRLALARAELQLNRVERARAVLEPVRDRASSHLGLALALVRTQLGNQLCPGFNPNLGNAPLCAAAWRHSNTQPEIERLVSDAWRSGQGRDPEAIESALGLRYIVPLLFRGPAVDAAQTHAALSGLTTSLNEIVDHPRFKALAQFARIVERAVNRQGKSDAKERSAWRSDAVAIYQKAPGEPATAATVLGLATWLAPNEDIRPLLDVVEPTTLHDAALLGVWIKLNATSALLYADTARLERSKALLPAWLQSVDTLPEEHSSLLLLLAQVEAALEPGNDKKWRTVLHLSSSDGTEEAQLQSTLALAALGQRVVALQRLEQFVQRSKLSETQNSFSTLGRVLTLGLRGLESKIASERAARAKEIAALLPSLGNGVDAAGSQLWAQLWGRRMQLADAGCPGLLCSAKLLLGSRDTFRRYDPHLLRMMERGVLPLGNLGLSWSYTFDRGLIPVVWVEPRWLVAP